jgi:hypothetical protein
MRSDLFGSDAVEHSAWASPTARTPIDDNAIWIVMLLRASAVTEPAAIGGAALVGRTPAS